MTAGNQSHAGHIPPNARPSISVCESGPGIAVFLETSNSDGWIASDMTVDVTQ
ncbi:MAG: hypothetical protein ABEH64_05145 [Salinirussus sp.]